MLQTLAKMFFILDYYQLKLSKAQASKAIIIVALQPPNIAIVTHHKQLHIYNIETPQIMFSQQLQSLPRKMLHHQPTNSLILHCPHEQQILRVDLLTMAVSQLYRFKGSFHYNTEHMIMRQKDYLSSMMFLPFRSSNLVAVSYQKFEERRQGVFVFEKVQGSWLCKEKDIKSSGAITDKFDESCRLVIWKEFISSNGSFSFTSLNLRNDQEEPISLNSPSFSLFSIVKKVKLDKKDNILIFVNHKHPQIICFTKKQQSYSQNLTTNTLWSLIFPNYSLNLSISLTEGTNARLELRQPQHSDIIETLEGKFSQVSVGQQGQWLIDYEVERVVTNEMRVRVVKVHERKMLLADLIEKWCSKIGWCASLSNDIFEFLV